MRSPDYLGGGLVNLAAELELRLSGRSASPGLHPELAAAIPEADSYLLVLIDGLGDLQLGIHPEGEVLSRYRAGRLDAPFPTQTSVATATLATGLPPSRHGLIAYVLRLEAGLTNTLWWFLDDGSPSPVDPAGFLPSPNVAERLLSTGGQALVVEPAAYIGSPLDGVLHRGATVVGAESEEQMVAAALEAAAEPRRLVLVYLPHVDAAAHASGTGSDAYRQALHVVGRVWESLAEGLGPGMAMVGSADHGMVDVPESGHIDVEPPDGLVLGGDSRVIHVHGDPEVARELANRLPARWLPFVEISDWWGPGPRHPEFGLRAPTGLIHAEPGIALHPPADRIRLVGNHGGASDEELAIPLLVASP